MTIDLERSDLLDKVEELGWISYKDNEVKSMGVQITPSIIYIQPLNEKQEPNVISFDDILNIGYENKVWGGVLNLEFIKNGKKEKYEFSVVQDWVKYPKKAPMKYIKADWSELAQYVKDRQKITN